MTLHSGITVPNALGAKDAPAPSPTADPDAPFFSAMIDFEGPREVSTMRFVVHCTNLPAWSQVAFSAPAPNIGGPDFLAIALPRISVPVPAGGNRGDIVPSFTASMKTQVIANYRSGLYYQYHSNGYTTPPGFSIAMQVWLMTDDGPLLLAGFATQFPLPDTN